MQGKGGKAASGKLALLARTKEARVHIKNHGEWSKRDGPLNEVNQLEAHPNNNDIYRPAQKSIRKEELILNERVKTSPQYTCTSI